MTPNVEDEYAKRKRKAREEQEDEAEQSYILPSFNPFLVLPSLDVSKGQPSADDVNQAKRRAHKDLLALKMKGLTEEEWNRKQSMVNQAADCIVEKPWQTLMVNYLAPKPSRSTSSTSRAGPSNQSYKHTNNTYAGTNSYKKPPKKPNQSSEKKTYSTYVDEGGDPKWMIGLIRMVKICENSQRRSVYIGEWKGTRNAVFASCARSPDRRLFLRVQHVDKFGKEIPTGAGHKSTVSLEEVELQQWVRRYRNDIDRLKAWVYRWTEPAILPEE